MPNKDYSDYKDKLIISDASPLIELYRLGKLDYLNRLFGNVYTTNTVKKECTKKLKFEMPDWIKIEEPQNVTKRIFRKLGFEKGELTAIALAFEKNLKQVDSSCLVLDDWSARKLIDDNKLEIKYFGLLQLMNFAFTQNYFNKEYIGELTKKMRKHKFRIPENAEDIIYGKKYNSNSRRV